MRWDSLRTLTRAEQLSDQFDDPEPRWPAIIAILAVGGSLRCIAR